MQRRFFGIATLVGVITSLLLGWWVVSAGNNIGQVIYAPLFRITEPTPTPPPTPSPPPLPADSEFRGMWVTRFDWTSAVSPANPSLLDEIVTNAAYAQINAILFQVRANADAYYTPGLEPWARRVSGTFGQPPNPYWDPLAYLIDRAHGAGIQVHAYVNVYPVWDDCSNPPPETVWPRPLYYVLRDAHGMTDGKLNGLQWTTTGSVSCSGYLRATPASITTDDHLVAVASDIVTRYGVDGLHLDHIRYAGSTTSCDPVSAARSGVTCFGQPPAGYDSYEAWQRTQVSGTVSRLYEDVVPLKPGLWLTAAVWPIYIDYWGWSGLEGYHDYYQDSKAWVQGGTIDAIMPMIYPSQYPDGCMENSGYWTQSKWQTLVTDFQASRGSRYVIPGIGTDYCQFAEIETRIAMARQIGTAGHALFSYGALKARGYFDDLRNGPYATPARVPDLPWHP